MYLALKPEHEHKPEHDGFYYMDALEKLTAVAAPLSLSRLREKALLHRSVVTVEQMQDVVGQAIEHRL